MVLEDVRLNDYIKTWLRSHRCASNMQIRTAGQKSEVKQEDPVYSRSSCRQMLTLFELFGVAFLFIWCENGIPTHPFLALHSFTWPLQPIVFKWKQNSPSTGIASWSRIDTTWMCCATLDPVMFINRKFDVPCKLGISHNLSTFQNQLH